MNKHIQIRNVSPALHKALVAKARREGLTLSEYLRREMALAAKRPTMAELLQRIRKRKPVKSQVLVADLIREDRESR